MKRHTPFLLAGLLGGLAFAQEAPAPVDPVSQAWLQFQEQYGTGWTVEWNKATGTPEAIYGPGLNLTEGPVESMTAARQHAENTLERFAALLGRGGSTFVETIGVKVNQVYVFVYDQRFKGLPVLGGRADVRVHATGGISMFGARSVPVPATFGITSPFTATQARDLAHRAMALTSWQPQAAPRLVIWADTEAPVPATPRLAWEVEIQGRMGALDRIGKVYIEALTGRMMLFKNEVYDLAPITGNVMCWTNTDLKPLTAAKNIPLRNLLVSIAGVGQTYTDALGNFSIPYTGTAPANLTLTLSGKHVKSITPLQGTAVTKTVQITPGTPLNIQLSTQTAGEFDRSQATTYWTVDSVNEYLRGILGSTGSSQMNTISQITCTVNRASSCNAYYSRNTINFYASSSTCNNTAITTVVAHEWGHGLDDRFGGVSQTEGLGEGWADTVAIYWSGQPVVGQDFRKNGGIVRTALNTLKYPVNSTSVHTMGQTWMGFCWDARNNLIASLGATKGVDVAEKVILASIVADATNQPAAMREVFILDDDDNNLDNGVPHYDELSKAATKRTIPYPVRKLGTIAHLALGSGAEQLTPRLVKADIVAITGTITKRELVYDLGAGPVRREMVHGSKANEYIALLPGVLSPASVSYHIEATHSSNSIIRYPATGELGYAIGKQETFFKDDFEGTNKGWTHGMVRTQDDWQWGTPTGKSGSSNGQTWADPGAAYSGTKCWGNDLGPTGFNGAYQPYVENWLRSPVLNLTGKTGVMLRFRRWLTVEESQYDQATISVNSTRVWINPYAGHVLDKKWELVEYRLAPADNNPAVTLEWRLKSDAGMHLGGWNIDDVEVFSFTQLPPPAVQYTMTPAQVGLGKTTAAAVKGKAGAAAFLLLSTTPGPLQLPGLPALAVGMQLNINLLTLDAKGEAKLSLTAPNDPVVKGAMLYSQVLEVSGTTTPVFTPSNPMITLIGN